ncbi:MAG: hypothetical protein WBF57_06585 [Mycobacterium sp.]
MRSGALPDDEPGQRQPTAAIGDGASNLMRVKVVAPVQVLFAGTRYTLGDTADVPDNVAQEWIRSGWATETKSAPARKKQVKQG